MFKEFKEFALKGNAITLAIGVVMGAAFNSIITAIVEGLFTPLIGVLLGGVDLSTSVVVIAGVPFSWGLVIDAIIKFIAVAIALFFVVKVVSKFAKEADPTTHPCPFCLTDIENAATRCPACTSEVTPA
jgi:large conductance mechanosensitive channel